MVDDYAYARKMSLMNTAATRGSSADHAEHLAGAAACSREALYAAANVITEQADTIAVLRKEVARRDDEIAALKRHIVGMGKSE